MNAKPRYRIEIRQHTPDGDDVVDVIDRIFGQPLNRESGQAYMAVEVRTHPGVYDADAQRRMVLVGPDHAFWKDDES